MLMQSNRSKGMGTGLMAAAQRTALPPDAAKRSGAASGGSVCWVAYNFCKAIHKCLSLPVLARPYKELYYSKQNYSPSNNRIATNWGRHSADCYCDANTKPQGAQNHISFPDLLYVDSLWLFGRAYPGFQLLLALFFHDDRRLPRHA